MRRTPTAACIGLLLLTLAAIGSQAQTAVPPACEGRDLLSEMKSSDPKSFLDIRAAADATANARALLWRVEALDRPASFLFGTLHSTDERVQKLSPAIQAAFEAASTVALELGELASGKAAEAMMGGKDISSRVTYPSGNGLADHLSPAELDKLRTILGRRGVPAATVQRIRPWFAWSALATPECEVRRVAAGLAFLDQQIGREAHRRGKAVIGLETVVGQVNALSGMPEASQVHLLKIALALIDSREDQWNVLHELYLARDIGAVLPFTLKLAEKVGFDPAVFAPIEQALIDKRNVTMRDAALPLLKEGNAFIAVGALHLSGKGGLVELFRAANFAVTPEE
jgi:uncharacterized protein YbaP (TraB family)